MSYLLKTKRGEVKSAVKGDTRLNMIAAGIAKGGSPFCSPAFAAKVGAFERDLTAELERMLR